MHARVPRPFDVALATAVGVVSCVGSVAAARHQPGTQPLDAAAFVLLAVGPVALLWRRTAPVAVLAVTVAAALAYLLLGYGEGPVFLSMVVAFLTAAPTTRRWPMYAVPAVGYVVFVWGVPWVTGGAVPPAAARVGLAAWLLTLLAVAELIRQRRDAARARRQRARAAARSAEEERLRRATEERLDIARELHDVLAHSLSMINVQSGVALELLESRPEQAGIALASIKTASRDALLEVHSMLRTLRRGGAELAPLAPAPTVADLDALVERARAAGIRVQTTTTGAAQPLPAAVDLAAARIVQEALTNVARHSGQTAARVSVRYLPGLLELEVDDDGVGDGGRAAPHGAGIAGMTERAHSLGGTLSAGPRSPHGFQVHARLPLPGNDIGGGEPT